MVPPRQGPPRGCLGDTIPESHLRWQPAPGCLGNANEMMFSRMKQRVRMKKHSTKSSAFAWRSGKSRLHIVCFYYYYFCDELTLSFCFCSGKQIVVPKHWSTSFPLSAMANLVTLSVRLKAKKCPNLSSNSTKNPRRWLVV